MKCKLLLLALTLSLLLPNLTGYYLVQAQAPISQSYTDSGSSITWIITEPKNQTYNTPNLNLSVTGETFMATLTNISYSIDGKQRLFLLMTYEKTHDDPITQVRRGYAQLPALSDGTHKITVYIDGWAGFPSKTIPTQKTVINVGISSATPVQDNYTHDNGVTIYSPCNQTYQPNQAITIRASSPTLGGSNIIYSATYTLDDGAPCNLETESQQIFSWDLFFGGLTGTATLPPLPEGKHKLTVYMATYIETTTKPAAMSGEATVYFSIGDTEPPNITLPTLNGSIFNQTSIPLNFISNEVTSWMGYCLDNGTQTTIATNTTLTVSAGNHTLIVYANDTAGNMGQSEVAYFSMQPPETSESQTGNNAVLIVTVFVIVAMAGIVLIVRKRKSNPDVGNLSFPFFVFIENYKNELELYEQAWKAPSVY